jgi:hypothetical protein
MLNTELNIAAADDFYHELIELHQISLTSRARS